MTNLSKSFSPGRLLYLTVAKMLYPTASFSEIYASRDQEFDMYKKGKDATFLLALNVVDIPSIENNLGLTTNQAKQLWTDWTELLAIIGKKEHDPAHTGNK